MITAKEYIEEKPKVIWMHGLELLEHVLKGDVRQTAYKDKYPSDKYLPSLRSELEKHKPQNGYQEAIDKHYIPDRKRVRIESKHGAFKVNPYMNGHKKCFSRRKRVITHKKAITLCIDAGIPYSWRGGTQMLERHAKIYSLAAKYAAENRPCRVVAVKHNQFDHRPNGEHRTITLFIIIKDYEEPMYPGIWGAFKTNASTNDLANVIWDYLVGCAQSNHGCPSSINVAEYIPYDEAQLVETSGKSKLYKTRID